jgi:hypothetical protein
VRFEVLRVLFLLGCDGVCCVRNVTTLEFDCVFWDVMVNVV